MDILESLKQLRDDIKIWVTNNLNALNAKIDEKTIPIDSELDSTSTNPVQNQAITKAINNIPRFSGDYNDLTNAPNIAEDDSGNMVIADESGNVIFKADSDGIHTTALSLNGEPVATESYVNEAVANIDIPETDLTGYATEEYVTDTIDAIVFPETDLTDYYTKSETDTAIEVTKVELSESIVAESEEWKVVDEAGNIIFSVDASGAHTTALSLNGQDVEDIIDERVAGLVDSAPDTLNTLNELATALGDNPNFATTITTEIGKKVDKESGKGLSANDFTDNYKNMLDNLGSMAFEETDPTVPAWAKAENKPEYTADEVGALANSTTLADLADDAEHRTVSDTEKATWDAKSNFSGDYNDLENAPNIVEDNEGNLVIADAEGNIIFRSDVNGFETTQLTTNTLIVDSINVIESLNEKLDVSDLNDAINTALSEAKVSGEFDGKDGTNGEDGHSPVRGVDYWTDTDKAEIKSYVDDAILGGAW